MSYLICEKHNKIEKSSNKLGSTAQVCMNRYCPNSFKIFCATCKIDHRDHAFKILTLEDITFLVDRLLKTPFKEVAKYVSDAVDVMKKLKLIKQFRKKIDLIEKQIQKEAWKLIESTQSLIHEYAVCKQSVIALSEILSTMQEPSKYAELQKESHNLLQNLDFNLKKDKLEYNNALIKEREDKRRKSFQVSKRKIEEVKDYSMKIIEVILHNNDSESDQDDIVYKKKYYEMLKQELCIAQEESANSQLSIKNSRSTSNKSRIRKPNQLLDSESQTNSQFTQEIQREYEERIMEIKQEQDNVENSYKEKLGKLERQKCGLQKEIKEWKEKYKAKLAAIQEVEVKLRRTKNQRVQKDKQKDELFNKMAEISQWKGFSHEDKHE